MSFGRHRQITENETEFQKKIFRDTSDFAEKLQKQINQNGGDFEKPVDVVTDTQVHEIIKPVKDEIPEPPVKEIKPQVTKPAREEIKKVDTNTRKKRQDKKEYTNIGIIGNTVVCRDFRAIVKKKGLQINTVLTEVLHLWNTANYNL